eukprot:TRINITY_DN1285_c1_g1_i1.p1 TRINITY_DN1285_c1_g1~~TRINITY_DN1285_c1_g1_i1.p1  ORF type:complete len:297 (-),score=70.28 TRINITY_DN1285_c1_g1_i1:224-1114(-)
MNSWLNSKQTEESLIGFASGAVYGVVSLIVGHPLDTLKTKMQAQDAHLHGSASKVFFTTLKKEGIVGLYRGCIPPLLGASVLRSVQFGVFRSVYHFLQPKVSADGKVDNSALLPNGLPSYSFGIINTNLLIAGMCSGAGRAIVECPLDLAKIRRQVGSTWTFRGIYKGLGVSMLRNMPLLTAFFIFLEYSKRVDMPSQWRPLLSGGICSTMAWTLVWPFDVIKSQVQGSTSNESFSTKARIHYQNNGIRGFFRGYGPGATRSLIANGLSMVAFVETEVYLRKYWDKKRRDNEQKQQ